MGYEIIWEPPVGVIKRHFGKVTGKELLEVVLRTEGDKRFDGLHYVVNDFLDCTGITITDSELEEIAAIDKAAFALNSKIRIAIVATHADAVAAASAYINSPMNSFETRLFDAMPAARRWLEMKA